ncbi:L-lactate dehydrogenase [Microbacterium sp. SORGH_AS428]|nr:L-lactate dehydrogenase [Microbacterium sp. SORGH_AS_0428]
MRTGCGRHRDAPGFLPANTPARVGRWACQTGVMSAIENSKLTVVGAGSVGSSVAYAALIRGSARHVALYDIATEKAEAEVLDLAHGTQFTGTSDIIGGSDLSVVEGSHVVVITAGAKQRPGQTRIELAGTNANIIKSMMPQLLEVAPNAIYVIVTNPCDVLTVLAQEATGLPVERIFASGTVLDTSRLRWKLAQRAGVSPSSVHAYIIGEHGDTEFPLWSSASIGTVPILDWQTPTHDRVTVDELDEIAVDVRDAAYKVIQGKGATNYAIGLSSARIVEAILQDEHAVMPVSTVLHGYHGIDGVALSVPSIVSASGAVPIPETAFSPNELGLLRRSADALRDVAASLR